MLIKYRDSYGAHFIKFVGDFFKFITHFNTPPNNDFY